MPITDLTGYTWIANDTLINLAYTLSNMNITYNLNMVCDNVIANKLHFCWWLDNGGSRVVSSPEPEIRGENYLSLDNDETYATTLIVSGGVGSEQLDTWEDDKFKTIEFLGGEDVENQTLITWLESNGTLTAPTPQSSASISVGNLSLAKSFIGNIEVNKIFLGNIKLYEKQMPSGYEVKLDGSSGAGEYVYVQINDDPTWYYAQLDSNGYGFSVGNTNIPNAYQADSLYLYTIIGISNISKIKIGTQGNPTDYTGPEYFASDSTGDFANLTFTSTGGSAPAYATSEITMTQNSKISFGGDF